MSFADKSLKCIECNGDFTYTAAEQELHKSLGYQNEPKRCTPCREAKRQRKGDKPPKAAGNAPPGQPQPPQSQPQGGGGRGPQERGGRRDNGPRDRDRGGRRDGGRPGGGGGPRRDERPPRREGGGGQGPRISEEFTPRETFIALCAGCGKEAVLPFKPRGDRPVYCSECFEKMRSGASLEEAPAPPAPAPAPPPEPPTAEVPPPPEPPPPPAP